MSQQRLRNQPVTVKPRIIVNGNAFKVERWGAHVKEHVASGFPTFEKAIEHANRVAPLYYREISEINAEQKQQRDARIRRNRLINEFGVDPLDVAA